MSETWPDMSEHLGTCRKTGPRDPDKAKCSGRRFFYLVSIFIVKGPERSGPIFFGKAELFFIQSLELQILIQIVTNVLDPS